MNYSIRQCLLEGPHKIGPRLALPHISGAVVVLLVFILPLVHLDAQTKVRARDLGIPFHGLTGQLNAITDVAGVEVGQVSIINGTGEHAARTGVTAIFPLGKSTDDRSPAAFFSFNGNGEMTGTAWLNESGFLEGPVVLTNTLSVGTARDAVVEWGLHHFPHSENFSLPVVAETYDAKLNDINGFHVSKGHVLQALEQASSGPVAEGNVGGGTGMVAFQFKGGIGTASRRLETLGHGYNVGVLVQANFGIRQQLTIAGVPVGNEIPDLMPEIETVHKDGSVIVVIAVDAPLLPSQLVRLAKRGPIGIARTGGVGMNSSGDLVVVFSTSRPAGGENAPQTWLALPNSALDPLFTAVADSTEEAIVNALVAAETMTGVNGNKIYGLPHDRTVQILAKYNRLRKTR